MDYTSTTITNWFHVDDPTAFRALLDGTSRLQIAYEADCYIDVDEHDDTVKLSVEGSLDGIVDTEDTNFDPDRTEGDYDLFIEFVQAHIADDDACIITTVGHEGLRSNYAGLTVVTKHKVTIVELPTVATRIARDMLGDPDFTPLI